MNFTIDRKLFTQVLSEVSNIIKENNNREILECLSIEAIEDKLIFTATNLSSDLVRTISCSIKESGKVVFKPSLVLEYIKLLEIDELNIFLVENTLHIHRAEFNIQDGNEFPNIKELTGDKLLTISSADLKRSIEKVRFSASTSTDNLAINVIRLNITPEFTEFVTTDSFRLIALKDETLKGEKEQLLSIPLETAVTLLKILGDDEEISLELYQNYSIFRFNNTYFASRVIELPFPNYSGILNSGSYSKVMEFNNRELKSGLKKVVSISKTSPDLKFGAIFDFKGKKLEIKVSAGSAKLSEKINMIKDGEDFKTSLNAKFLLDFVSLAKENIIIKGMDSHSRFELGEFGEENYRYIVMPLATRQ